MCIKCLHRTGSSSSVTSKAIIRICHGFLINIKSLQQYYNIIQQNPSKKHKHNICHTWVVPQWKANCAINTHIAIHLYLYNYIMEKSLEFKINIVNIVYTSGSPSKSFMQVHVCIESKVGSTDCLYMVSLKVCEEPEAWD